MPSPAPETAQPLRIVVDSCVFPRRAWLGPILDSALSGYVVPIWSPLIIAEVNRFLTWQWLGRHGGDRSAAAWRQCSADAKRWFELMTQAVRVIDDCPPRDSLWGAALDVWDAPIWTAAARVRANVVVTDNLRHGPPKSDRGLQEYDGIVCLHPDQLHWLLEAWSDRCDAEGWAPVSEVPWPESIQARTVPPVLDELLDRLAKSAPRTGWR